MRLLTSRLGVALALGLALCLCLLLAAPASADYQELREEDLVYAYPSIRRVIGMYSLEDSPSFAGAKKVQPFIQLDLHFKRTLLGQEAPAPVPSAAGTHATGTLAVGTSRVLLEDDASKPRELKESADPRVQVLLLQDPTLTLSGIGHPSATEEGLVDYCCTQDLFNARVPGCDEVGTLIVKPGNGVHKLLSAYFTVEHPSEAFLKGVDGRYDVTSTGEHILIVANCDARLAEYTTSMTGSGIWKNPYGYLPGRLFGFLPFYFAMLIVYIVFTGVWAVLCWKHRKDIAGIQYCISAVLVLTLVEVLCWFVDYHGFNETGVRRMSIVISAIIFSVLRLTVSRMLVVAVSIGFPVVRPTLGLGTKLKIGSLGLLYFLCEAALEVVTRYSQVNETAEKWRIFLSLPVAVLNAIFYWWIFTALHDLLNYLEQLNQAIKLSMYKMFTHMLAGSLIAAVLFAIYQIYFMATNQLALHWSLLWLLDGGFQLLLYTVIFACIAWLWRPSSDSRRYAYSELSIGGGGEVGSMEDEDEGEFGPVELEMGSMDEPSTATDDGRRAHITTDNAKFTVEEDEQ